MTTKEITNNLIINYLPQFLTDEEFKNMFLTIGPLKSTKIVRDKATGFSYGFGFAEFVSVDDAERAVKVFDYLPMYGKRIRVQHANKSDELSKGYNIYVKNIPSEYTESELEKLFEPFGKISTCKVLIDLQTGQSKNVGFVLYDTKGEADKAISEMHGKKCPGSNNYLVVKYADDSSVKKSGKNMPIPPILPQVTPASPLVAPPPILNHGNGFVSHNSQAGPVRNQTANRFRFNPMAREDTTFGHQSSFGSGFTSPSTGGYQSGMTSPEPSYAGSLTDIPQGPGPFSIFVHNIGEDAEDRELWALFSPFGTVQKCTVMMDTDRKVCKGFGFVDMVHVMEASNAIQNLNGYFYKGRKLSVSFKHKK